MDFLGHCVSIGSAKSRKKFIFPSPFSSLISSYSIQSVAACGDSYEGVAMAAAMYHKEVSKHTQ